MSTRLIVMRHADSSWPPGVQLDHDRPLSAQGRLEAPMMSQALIQRDWLPELALISSSARTQETFSLMMEVQSEIRPEIYLADLEILLPIATGIEEDKTTLILGHNPGCEMLVSTLCGVYHPIPPATCALFTKNGPNWNLESVLRFAEMD
jgi:phosphohistidine phosphatase|tara:strand:- start:459 stop:908 length:450 start_codon:yes stop_codon:yes gene_type:complete